MVREPDPLPRFAVGCGKGLAAEVGNGQDSPMMLAFDARSLGELEVIEIPEGPLSAPSAAPEPLRWLVGEGEAAQVPFAAVDEDPLGCVGVWRAIASLGDAARRPH